MSPRLSPEQLTDGYARLAPPRASGSMFEHALDWARQGWNVLPPQPGKKEPMRGSRGAHDGAQDEAMTRQR